MEIIEVKGKNGAGEEVTYKNTKLSTMTAGEKLTGTVQFIKKKVTGQYGVMTNVTLDIPETGVASFIVGGQNCGWIDGTLVKLIDVFDEINQGDNITVELEIVKNQSGREFKNYKLFKE